MIWALLVIMAAAAVAFVIKPVLPRRALAGLTAFAVAGLSFVLYAGIGSPDVSSSERQPDIDDVVTALADRLEDDPTDIEGWKMLGRSYVTLGRYEEAEAPLRRAIELEDGRNAQTLVDLGEVLLAKSGQQMTTEAIAMFESAVALEPSNPSALFWSGIAAANRGEIDLAATRWEALLATNPPGNIRTLIESRVAEWRGEPAPAAAPGITVRLSADAGVVNALPSDTTVFVLARDAAAGGPPLAVTRRRLGDLPAVVTLSDADAMVPGRVISAFETVEIVARASVSGQPAAAPGDWFASQIASAGDDIALTIDQPVR